MGVIIALMLLLSPLPAGAAERVWRVAVIWSWDAWPYGDPLQEELRTLGYVDGRNLRFVARGAKADPEQAHELVRELVGLNVDVLVTIGEMTTGVAKDVTTTIPVVMVGVLDPVGHGLISSLARPGRNITGVASAVPGGVFTKQLQLLKEAVPRASRVGVLTNPTNPSHSQAIRRELLNAAQTLGMTIRFLEASTHRELVGGLGATTRENVDVLLTLPDPVSWIGRWQIAEHALRARLPTMHFMADHVDVGGLLSYGPRSIDLYRRAAVYVDKILKGARPADLPVEQPTTFELIVNLRAARAIGLTIPQSVLIRADHVLGRER